MSNVNQHLYPIRKDNKSGFINKNGEIIIPPKFEGAAVFLEGLARIFVGDHVGFIDMRGDIVIPPKFDSAMDFSEGLAPVTIDGKQGFINTKGEIVIQPSYHQARIFKNGIALVWENIKSEGSFIDKTGQTVLKGNNFMISKYSEGLINCANNGRWGFIDLNGHFVIPANYKDAREFSEGKAAVTPERDIQGKANRKNLFGFINRYNEMIIPPVYKGSDIKFSEGMCAVWDNGYGYINDTGTLVIPCDLDLGMHFHEGLAVFKPKGRNQKYGYLDKAGNVVIEPVFTDASAFQNGLAEVIVGKSYNEFRYGYIDKMGRYIWEPTR